MSIQDKYHLLKADFYEEDTTEQRHKEIADACRRDAELGDAQSQYALGNLYYNGGGVEQSYVEAEKWYRKAAEQGYASAQYALGVLKYYGLVIKPSHEEAISWFQKAAEQGNSSAIGMLKQIEKEEHPEKAEKKKIEIFEN